MLKPRAVGIGYAKGNLENTWQAKINWSTQERYLLVRWSMVRDILGFPSFIAPNLMALHFPDRWETCVSRRGDRSRRVQGCGKSRGWLHYVLGREVGRILLTCTWASFLGEQLNSSKSINGLIMFVHGVRSVNLLYMVKRAQVVALHCCSTRQRPASEEQQ